MSWLARSIANTLNLEDEEEEEEEEEHVHNENNKEAHNHNDEEHHLVDSSSSPPSPGRGVKEDLSELTKTLTSQFWGVASFLAPPPASEHSQISSSNPNEPSYPAETTSDQASTEPEMISGIRSDFAEIGGKFRSGISRLSSNIPVSEITKMASSFLQLGSEEDNYDPVIIGGVGVTEEVVAFVRDIAMHPKTWLDFPLLEDEDFDMSDAQQEHALAIERLAPRLAALRIELCPGYMSEGCFWKIYFVLLHPRLDIHDAELLSTPQIVKARALLTQELQNHRRATPEEDLSKRDISYSKGISNSPHEECPDESLALETSALESVNSRVAADSETEKHPILSTEIQIIDKSVIEEGPVNKNKDQNLLSHSLFNAVKTKDEDDGEDWLKEENLEIVGASGPTISIANEQDVSFSDLEEDDELEDAPTSYEKVTSSTKDSRDWVQLSRSSADSAKDINSSAIDRAGLEQVSVHNPEIKESNDWLDVDDIDVA